MARLFALALAVAAIAPTHAHAQLADPAPLDEEPYTGDAPSDAPRFDLSGPLALTIAGAALTAAGAVLLVAAGFESWDGFEDGSPPQAFVWMGTIGVALGIPLLFAGVYWLIDRLEGRSRARSSAQRPFEVRF
ncbi:MAG: hypothetical protein AB7S26_21020 [Sandaracinaceae bacterium]